MVITKSAVRIYENKQKAKSTYGKPIIAIPLSAVKRVERTKFDATHDIRFENQQQNLNQSEVQQLLNNMFEFIIKDEFLPIYTHMQYTKIFKESSISMELSPDKRRSGIGKNSKMSPFRDSMQASTISKRSSAMTSPGGLKSSHVLDMHKKTGIETRQSPSKAAKIVMKYINNYSDVGPIVAPKAITYADLIEMAKTVDKKDLWAKSDLRIMFSLGDPQIADETIETLDSIVSN